MCRCSFQRGKAADQVSFPKSIWHHIQLNDGLLGGWSEAVWLQKGLKLVRIPSQLSPATFIGGGCGLVTALHATDRAEIRLGSSVAVLGAGPVGQSAIALSRLLGAADAVTDALEMVRDGGRVVVCGQYTDSGDVTINPHRLINRKHVELRGVWGSDYSHLHRAVQIAAKFGDTVPWGGMAAERFGLEQAGSALEAVASRELVKAIVAPNG